MGRRPGKKFVAPGFRTRARGARTYYFYDAGGKPRKEIALGTDFAAALQKWAELRGAGHDRAAEAITFRYVADRFLREVSPTKSDATLKDHRRESANLFRFFDDPPILLEDMRPIHVRQYMDWRNKDAIARVVAANTRRRAAGNPEAPVTGEEGKVRANREKALLSAIWNQAREWGYTALTNPCQGVKGNRETGRDVYIEDDLYQQVYDAGGAPLRDAMDLAYLTGQRVADTIKVSEADIRDGVLYVRQNKTKVKLRMNVIGELAALIERVKERKRTLTVVSLSALLVDERGKALTYWTLRYRFDQARAAAGIDKNLFQFRDLRAKASSDTTESTGDIRKAQKQLGHTTVAMTEHYTRARRGSKVDPTR